MDRSRERRLERLVGRRVYDPQGRVVGRLQEFHAEKEGEHYVVTEFRIGTAALLERLAIETLGVHRSVRGYRARWDQLNLEDPDRPTLTCGVEELSVIRRGA